jgi:hypothetical protein
MDWMDPVSAWSDEFQLASKNSGACYHQEEELPKDNFSNVEDRLGQERFRIHHYGGYIKSISSL